MEHSDQVTRGERFAFGRNWEQFLKSVNRSRVAEAERSLQSMLGLNDLTNKTFLDIGCGSGLFSLAARQLGAEVHSFDYDPQSVACTRELKRRFFPQDEVWKIDEASALDSEYVTNTGTFDIVYSWGVLHHTGDMSRALRNAAIPVKIGGLLFVAIYNDQDQASKVWKQIKKMYCSGTIGRTVVRAVFLPYFIAESLAIGLIKYGNPMGHIRAYKRNRGMSIYYDAVDWLGGYPFEVARPEGIVRFYTTAGFELRNLTTTNRRGCNQYVFQKTGLPQRTGEVL
jgi:2-polyprenyl-3-methyl-5-hydroxy-6-metoxy-1,4-benzoquinol methylase